MAKKSKVSMKKEKFTKFEIARLIGSRALQISQGAPFLLKFTKKDLAELNYDPIEMAKKEFKAGVLLIEIKRVLPHMQR